MSSLPKTILVAPCSFGNRFSAVQVADAIAKGLASGGIKAIDLCPISDRNSLNANEFDRRMRQALAVVLSEVELTRTTLAGTAFSQAATHCRQAGVSTYAIVGSNRMTLFETRILDLQRIYEAKDAHAIEAAACELTNYLPSG